MSAPYAARCPVTSSPYATLLLGLGMLTFSASARAAPVIRAEREVVLPGVAGHEAPTVYGAADFPLTLVFDGPLRKEGLTLPGADLRLHPFIADSVLLTPSQELAARGSVPFRVPLVDGTAVELRLAFIPARVDGRVRIVRRGAPPPHVAARFEVLREGRKEALRVAAAAILGGRREECNSVGDLVPKRVKVPNEGRRRAPRVCLLMALAYIRAPATCVAPSIRVERQAGEPVELLFSEVSCPPGDACTATLVVRSPAPAEHPDVALTLLEKDGTVCARFTSVWLRP